MRKRTPDRVELIRSIAANSRFASLLMEPGETTHIVHHEHSDDDADCTSVKCILRKRVKSFSDTIRRIGGKLEYIKSGTTGHTFRGVSPESNFSYAVKIAAYQKKSHYPGPNDIQRPENAELLMAKLLSKLVVDKKTPHIVLPIGTFDADLSEIISMTRDKIEDSPRYNEFVERFAKNEFYPQASVMLLEWAEGGDLLDYIRNNYKSMSELDWKIIFFQVLQCLAAIQSEYPDFRHNDAKPNNWLCRRIPMETDLPPQYHGYRGVGKCYYLVENRGIHTVMTDFDFACIPGIVDNTKVESKGTDHINIRPECHQYYDVHYFFNTLQHKPFFPKIHTSKRIPGSVKAFINRVVPPKYRDDQRYVTQGGRINTADEVWSPLKLLEMDPFFEEFRFTSRDEFEARKQQARELRKRALEKGRGSNGDRSSSHANLPDRDA
jgi:serine/threonine protein kinase